MSSECMFSLNHSVSICKNGNAVDDVFETGLTTNSLPVNFSSEYFDMVVVNIIGVIF